jgi:hypothetical protein
LAGDAGQAGADSGGGLLDNGGGNTGGTGGAIIVIEPPVPGTLGEACIPGATANAGTGLATAQVTTLNHCFAGLSCSAAGKCVRIPNCPQPVGPCVVAEVVPSLGMGGAPSAGGGYAGSSGGPGGGYGQIVAEADISGVTSLSADSANLYWLQYGTRDALGNHQGDGALMAMDLATQERTQILSHLPGPIAFGLTTAHVFVFVDGGGLIGTLVHPQLLRFPLQGGAAQIIQDGAPPLSPSSQTFLSSQDQAFWHGATGLYALSGSATTATVFNSSSFCQPIDADSDNLYFWIANSFFRAPLAGGALTDLTLEARPAALNGDFLYGLEASGDGTLLTRAAKSSGTWQRVRALGSGYPRTLKTSGDRYFWDWASPSSPRSGISTALFSDSLPATQIVGPEEDAALYWVGTADKLYWSDGQRIFARSFASP